MWGWPWGLCSVFDFILCIPVEFFLGVRFHCFFLLPSVLKWVVFTLLARWVSCGFSFCQACSATQNFGVWSFFPWAFFLANQLIEVLCLFWVSIEKKLVHFKFFFSFFSFNCFEISLLNSISHVTSSSSVMAYFLQISSDFTNYIDMNIHRSNLSDHMLLEERKKAKK